MSEDGTKIDISLISGFSRRLILSTMLAMIIAASLSLLLTVAVFNAGLRPYLVDKARAVAASVNHDISYAMEIGIPFEEIRGLDEHIDALVAEHPEVSGLGVVTNADAALAGAGQSSLGSSTARNSIAAPIGVGIVQSLRDAAAILMRAGATVEVVSVDVLKDGVPLARVEACAVERRVFLAGANPAQQLSLRLVAA